MALWSAGCLVAGGAFAVAAGRSGDAGTRLEYAGGLFLLLGLGMLGGSLPLFR